MPDLHKYTNCSKDDLSEDALRRDETVNIAFNSAINILKEAQVSYVLITAAYLGEITATKIAKGISDDNIHERMAITKILQGTL